MAKAKYIDWVVFCDAEHPQHPFSLLCRRCGGVQPLTSPVAVTALLKYFSAFQEQHKFCKETKRP